MLRGFLTIFAGRRLLWLALGAEFFVGKFAPGRHGTSMNSQLFSIEKPNIAHLHNVMHMTGENERTRGEPCMPCTYSRQTANCAEPRCEPNCSRIQKTSRSVQMLHRH